MLTVYHSPTHLFSPVHLSFSALCQLEQLSHLQQKLVPLQLPLLEVLLPQMLFPLIVSGLPLSVGRSWSGSMCRAHVASQELHAVSMMLDRMAFYLCGKVVAFHLDNSTSKAYLCNQGDILSPFLSRLACQILSLTGKHSITLIPAYIPTHLNVESDYLSWGWLLPQWHLLSQMAQVAFPL